MDKSAKDGSVDSGFPVIRSGIPIKIRDPRIKPTGDSHKPGEAKAETGSPSTDKKALKSPSTKPTNSGMMAVPPMDLSSMGSPNASDPETSKNSDKKKSPKAPLMENEGNVKEKAKVFGNKSKVSSKLISPRASRTSLLRMERTNSVMSSKNANEESLLNTNSAKTLKLLNANVKKDKVEKELAETPRSISNRSDVTKRSTSPVKKTFQPISPKAIHQKGTSAVDEGAIVGGCRATEKGQVTPNNGPTPETSISDLTISKSVFIPKTSIASHLPTKVDSTLIEIITMNNQLEETSIPKNNSKAESLTVPPELKSLQEIAAPLKRLLAGTSSDSEAPTPSSHDLDTNDNEIIVTPERVPVLPECAESVSGITLKASIVSIDDTAPTDSKHQASEAASKNVPSEGGSSEQGSVKSGKTLPPVKKSGIQPLINKFRNQGNPESRAAITRPAAGPPKISAKAITGKKDDKPLTPTLKLSDMSNSSNKCLSKSSSKITIKELRKVPQEAVESTDEGMNTDRTVVLESPGAKQGPLDSAKKDKDPDKSAKPSKNPAPPLKAPVCPPRNRVPSPPIRTTPNLTLKETPNAAVSKAGVKKATSSGSVTSRSGMWTQRTAIKKLPNEKPKPTVSSKTGPSAGNQGARVAAVGSTPLVTPRNTLKTKEILQKSPMKSGKPSIQARATTNLSRTPSKASVTETLSPRSKSPNTTVVAKPCTKIPSKGSLTNRTNISNSSASATPRPSLGSRFTSKERQIENQKLKVFENLEKQLCIVQTEFLTKYENLRKTSGDRLTKSYKLVSLLQDTDQKLLVNKDDLVKMPNTSRSVEINEVKNKIKVTLDKSLNIFIDKLMVLSDGATNDPSDMRQTYANELREEMKKLSMLHLDGLCQEIDVLVEPSANDKCLVKTLQKALEDERSSKVVLQKQLAELEDNHMVATRAIREYLSKKCHDEVSRLEMQLEDITTTLELVQARETKELNSQLQEIDTLKTQNETLLGQLSSSRDTVLALEKERDLIKGEVAGANTRLKELEDTYARASEELTKCQKEVIAHSKAEAKYAEDIINLSDEIARLRGELTGTMDNLERIRVQLASDMSTAACEELTLDKEAEQQKVSKLTEELSLRAGELKVLEAENQNLKEKIEAMDTTKNDKQEQIEELRLSLCSEIKMREHMEEILSRKDEELRSRMGAIQELQQTEDDVRKQCQELRNELQQYRDARSKVADIQDQVILIDSLQDCNERHQMLRVRNEEKIALLEAEKRHLKDTMAYFPDDSLDDDDDDEDESTDEKEDTKDDTLADSELPTNADPSFFAAIAKFFDSGSSLETSLEKKNTPKNIDNSSEDDDFVRDYAKQRRPARNNLLIFKKYGR